MRKLLFQRSLLFLLFFVISRSGVGQTCVVIDKVTGEPVLHASLYSKAGGKFQAAITDADGRANVTFPYHTITVSHLNYEKLVVTRLPDTLRLVPKAYMTAEVVVQEKEPAWIKKKLRQVVKQKDRNYFTRDLVLNYDYTTQSIGNKSFYRFRSDGFLRIRHPDENYYHFHQAKGVITANDSTRLTDVENLRRMLYEDFITHLDASFIRTHRFAVNEEYQGNSGEVELAFRSTKHPVDHGRIVVDTARCVVLSASRITGTEANRDIRTSSIMLTLARVLSGYVIRAWDVDYRVTYTHTGGCWHPCEIRYKSYFKEEESRPDKNDREYNRETGGGFTNMEGELHILPLSEQPYEVIWKRLPASWYLRFNSDEERAYEIELSHLPAEFEVFEE